MGDVMARETVRNCEFPGSSCACWKCAACLSILRSREARATPHADLIARQSCQRCRICDRVERYCQTDGQGRGKHPFSPVMTCESCSHMGGRYWGDDDMPIHFCRKSSERRAEVFKSCGDRSQDFMDEFRKFYDASPKYSAEMCSFFAPRQQ